MKNDLVLYTVLHNLSPSFSDVWWQTTLNLLLTNKVLFIVCSSFMVAPVAWLPQQPFALWGRDP